MDQFVKKQKREDVGTEGPRIKKIAVVLELNAKALKKCIGQVCTIDGLPSNTFEKTGCEKFLILLYNS